MCPHNFLDLVLQQFIILTIYYSANCSYDFIYTTCFVFYHTQRWHLTPNLNPSKIPTEIKLTIISGKEKHQVLTFEKSKPSRFGTCLIIMKIVLNAYMFHHFFFAIVKLVLAEFGSEKVTFKGAQVISKANNFCIAELKD